MHAVDGAVASSAVTDGLSAPPLLAGQTLTFAVAAGDVTVNGVDITSFDITASNGVIHVLGGVLLPVTP
jgi:transforming growth factor-beta-induced protein